jgi:hypothetical protein
LQNVRLLDKKQQDYGASQYRCLGRTRHRRALHR